MKTSKPLCRFCHNRKCSPIKMVAERIHTTYFDTFNFYFAKPINEIIANVQNTAHIVWFKDYQVWDEEGEFLKRFYRRDEVKPRVDILTEFYHNNYKPMHPNLIVTDCHQIVGKRISKQDKLFFQRLNKDDEQFNKGPNEPEEIVNRILHSNLSASSYNRPDETSHAVARPQQSFETEEHDIYSQATSRVVSVKRPMLKLQGLNLIENLDLLTHSQVNWSPQDREVDTVFENYNHTKSVAHIQRVCRQSQIALDPVPLIFLKKGDQLSDFELNSLRKSTRDSKPQNNTYRSKKMPREPTPIEQHSMSQFQTSNIRLHLSNEDTPNELNDSDAAKRFIPVSSSQLNIPHVKGKLTRVHSDTSSIQNVLKQVQKEKNATPKVVNKNALEIGKALRSKQVPPKNDNRLNRLSASEMRSQETPESARIQHGNFMLKDQYRGLPVSNITDIAQGYQGSQKSIKGNNISVSSIHNNNQNGSVHSNNNLSSQQGIASQLARAVKGSMTERASINSPDNILRQQAQLREKILQVNQLSSHIGVPLGFQTDRDGKERTLTYTKTKADLLQYSSVNSDTAKPFGTPAFTDEILTRIQDMQAKKMSKNSSKEPSSQRFAQMPQKYLIQSQYNTIQTAKQSLTQKAKSNNQVTSSALSKNADMKREYNNSDVNYLTQRSQDSTARPLTSQKSFNQQRSSNISSKTSSHQANKLASEDGIFISGTTTKMGPSLNGSLPVSPLKKFDFKLNLRNLKKEPLEDCQEELFEDEAPIQRSKMGNQPVTKMGLEAYLMKQKKKQK